MNREHHSDEDRVGGLTGVLRRLSDRPRRLAVAVGAAILCAVLLLAVGVAFDLTTASPRSCSACHEMKTRAGSWAESAHSTVACVECHQRPTAWYELPRRILDRSRLLGRDIVAHRSGDFVDPVDGQSAGSDPMSDDICLQCHDPNRKATSGFRILIDHPEHARRNGSCVSCHVRTAHPIESRGTAMSLMSQCFTCHGSATQPKASAECGLCHPADYQLLPASHAETRWARGHGDVATSDKSQCGMCHASTFCDDCHGLAMPHPDGWATGQDSHAAAAASDPEVCSNCHGSYPDLCTMCHHTSYDPMKGAWIGQHDAEVKAEGSKYCEECHPRPYCTFCHTRLVERTSP